MNAGVGMLASSEIISGRVPLVLPPLEMEAGNVGRPRSGPVAYSPLARDGSGEIVEVAEHVVNVDELLRSSQFASDGTSEVCMWTIFTLPHTVLGFRFHMV